VCGTWVDAHADIKEMDTAAVHHCIRDPSAETHRLKAKLQPVVTDNLIKNDGLIAGRLLKRQVA
jgi:hypothetical protein